MIKFIHAADIHLDSPLRGLAQKEYLPADLIRSATRKALTNLVNLAIDEKVDFVLLAGDLYDRNWDDSATGFYFIGEMKRLEGNKIPVVMITGNHDAVTIIKKPLPYPDNVVILDSKKPQSHHILKEEILLAVVHGQSFQDKAVTSNLASKYPPSIPGTINIGILHTSLEGSSEHDTYAPADIQELILKEYDYWALGHIHKREVVNTNPWIVYPGNIQGRNIRETGAKGCYLVEFEGHGKAKLDFRDLDVFRWLTLEIDLGGISDKQGFLEAVSIVIGEKQLDETQIPHGIRVILTGETPFHDQLAFDTNWARDEIQALFIDKGNNLLFVEKLVLETKAPSKGDKHGNSLSEDALNIIHKTIDSLRKDPDSLKKLIMDSELADLAKRIPNPWREENDPDAILPLDINWLAPLLDQVGPFIETTDRKNRGQR